MAERIVQEESLISVADTIRAKGGTTEPLTFPAGFKTAIESIQTGGEQATPVIAVSDSGLITATAGDKSATKQLSTQSGKTITPGPTEQIAVEAGKYVTGDVLVAAVENTGGGGSGGPLVSISVVGGTDRSKDTVTVNVGTPTVSVAYQDPDYVVKSVEGAPYGFSRSGNYFVSGNRGVHNSYAMCLIVFYFKEERTVTINCINSGEANHDFGLISEVDTMLSMDNSADSTGVFKSFYGQSSTSVVPIQMTIPAGEHFVCVKFKKDGSTSSGNDTLQFDVEGLMRG